MAVPPSPTAETFLTPAPWRGLADVVTALAAIAITLAIFGAGHLAGTVVASALGLWQSALDANGLRLATPLLTSIYQLMFGWLALRWYLRRTNEALQWRAALSLTMPSLKAWQWIAIALALYALKALASVVALAIAMPAGMAGGALGGSNGAAAAGLGPLAMLLRSNAWLLMLAGGIAAAVVEEILFRGYLSRALESTRLGWFGGAMVASLIWAGMHIYYPLAMQSVLVVMGVALSYTRLRTGSLYPGMAWHILNNVIGLLALRAIG